MSLAGLLCFPHSQSCSKTVEAMNDQPKLSADCDMLDPEDFPGILRDIAEVAGVEAALAVVRRRGGEVAGFPSARFLRKDHWLVEAVGFEKAICIAERVSPAEKGIREKIPLGPASDLWKLRARHERTLTQVFFSTASINEIVREHGISRNAILRHFRRMRDDGFHRPKKPKNGHATNDA